MSLPLVGSLGRRLAQAFRPIVSGIYTFKRQYRIGDRFLARHPRATDALMMLLRPFKTSSAVDVFGHVLEVDESDYLGLTINRIYEPDITTYLTTAVRPGQNAIDLGANIGYFTLLFARLIGPSGHVVAFEPDAENFRLLERNVLANHYANVTLRRQAVSDRSGRTLLYRSSTNPGDHRLADTGDREAVEVEVVALDEELPSLCDNFHWIKMDIQGAEVAALRGMRSLIQSSPEISIIAEFCPLTIFECGDDPDEFFAILSELGFSVSHVEKNGALRALSAESALQRAGMDGTYLNLVFMRPGINRRRSVEFALP